MSNSQVVHIEAPASEIQVSDCFSFNNDVILMADKRNGDIITANAVWRRDGGALGTMVVPAGHKYANIYRMIPRSQREPQGTIRTYPSLESVFQAIR